MPTISSTTTLKKNVPQYEILINGKSINAKLIAVNHVSGMNISTAIIELPKTWKSKVFNAGDTVIIWADITRKIEPCFVGNLFEVSSELPDRLTWTAINGIEKLDRYPIARKYNRNNSTTVSSTAFTGYTIGDIIADVILLADEPVQSSISTYPSDFPGQREYFGDKPTKVITELLNDASNKYSFRVRYTSGGTQVLDGWVFGRGNNRPAKKLVCGEKGKKFTDVTNGRANIAAGNYGEDYSGLVNRIYCHGGKKLVEATVVLTPSWSSSLNAAVLANPSITKTNPDVYGDVFRKWVMPLWNCYDSETGITPSEYETTLTYPNIILDLPTDATVARKPNTAFLWISNPKIIGSGMSKNEIVIDSKNLRFCDNGFKIEKDGDGFDHYLILDEQLAMWLKDDLTMDAVKAAGDVMLTALFEVPEAAFVDTGRQGSFTDDRAEFIQYPEYFKQIFRGVTAFLASQSTPLNPNTTYVFNSILPIFDSNGIMYGVDEGSYDLRNDYTYFYNICMNKLRWSKDPVKTMTAIIPTMDTTWLPGDLDIVSGLNCISVSHDFVNMTTTVNLGSA